MPSAAQCGGYRRDVMDTDELQRFWQKPQLLGDFLRLFSRQYRDNGCRESAAALTYTTLFAIVPMMTVAFAILAALPALRERSAEIQRWVFEYFAPSVGDDVLAQLNEFSRQAGNLTGVGIIFLVVTSVLMLRTIEQNLNRIWRIRTPRKGTTSLLMYWAVLTLGPLCLGAALGLSSYLTSIKLLTGAVDYLGGVAFWLSLLPFVAMTALMATIYIIVPNCYVPLRQGLLGGAVAALLFELAKAGFALFIRLSPSYSVIYGAFAAVPLFLLWVYISWMIFLGGAVLVHTLVIFEEHRKQSPRLQSLLRLLAILREKQQQGSELRPAEVRAVLRAAGAMRWDDFRNLLMDIGLMRRTVDDGFVLARDLSTLTLGELVALLPWPASETLAVTDDRQRGWEHDLAERCRAAVDGMKAPLQISLADLFEQKQHEKADAKRG